MLALDGFSQPTKIVQFPALAESDCGKLHESVASSTRFAVWIAQSAFGSMGARATKFRKAEGGTAWYASRTEAVGLGRVVPSSFFIFPSDFALRLS
jgi:hypothetical protein